MKCHKRQLAVGLLTALFFFQPFLGVSAEENSPAAKRIEIGVTKIVSHPGIDAVQNGFMEIVNGYGKEQGVEIKFDLQNAQGDMATSMLIVKKFVADEVSLIFTISTPSTQHAVKATSKIPIIFGAVTDPVSAGIVKDLQHPGGNVTGVSDVWPIKKQVELLLKLVPSVKRLGLVYNPGESNATFMLGKLQEACDQIGFDLITRAISNTGEVMMAAKNLAPRVDAFYSSIDNTVLAAIASLVKAANQYKKPIIAGESDSVKEGAIATLGTNYYEIGKDSGILAIKVLQGAEPGDLSVISDTKTVLYLNLKALKFLNIKVPSEMEKGAKEIFE